MTNPHPDSLDLGRGMTNPQFYIEPKQEILKMSNTENNAPESQFTEEQLESTQVFKGFQGFVFGADIMQRYPFSLSETKGGRIFVDGNNNTKLRRKVIRGQPQQNYMFEAYETVDNQARVKAEVEISSNGFTPSMLLAAVAAKVSNDGHPKYNRIAVLLIQVASALLQDGERALRGEKKLNEEGDAIRAAYYRSQSAIIARANAMMGLGDILTNLIRDDEVVSSGFEEDFTALRQFKQDPSLSEDDLTEIENTINLLFASVANFAFSPAMQDVLVMAEEIKENLGQAALTELSDAEQK